MSDNLFPQRIRRLPEYLVNQIAAGEVIERPASVIKELLENSLDAGASDIYIDIECGGVRLIRVRDNGHGIHADDLALAVETHTTSKLLDTEGLWRITTLGFRGEALPSIASVSKFTITSRQSEDDHGHALIIDGTGGISPFKPAPHPVGTTIEVRDLFYNTPARRKFLRSERTEFIHIHELIRRLAMGHCNVSFHLTHNSRPVMNLAGTGAEARVSAIFGRKFLGNAQYVNQVYGDMSLQGWIGLPETARSQTDQQYFYLNDRSIRDKLINHAVRLACQNTLQAGRHPVYLLYFKMNTESFDINVHPAKQEVRFQDARSVHDFIYGSISRALIARISTEEINTAQRSGHDFHVSDHETVHESTSYSVHSGVNAHQKYNTCISIAGRYLVAEENNKLLLVDVYRAREFILLQRFNESLARETISRHLIRVPLGLTLTEAELQLLESENALLESFGFELQPAGPTRILIRSVPLMLAGADVAELVNDMIKVISAEKTSGRLTEMFIETISLHANDSASADLSHVEMTELLKDLSMFRDNETQFRKIFRHIDPDELKILLSGK